MECKWIRAACLLACCLVEATGDAKVLDGDTDRNRTRRLLPAACLLNARRQPAAGQMPASCLPAAACCMPAACLLPYTKLEQELQCLLMSF